MNIYLNTLRSGEKLKALYLLSSVGSFYAEPVNDGVIGEGLLYNDYMFHFEGNEDRSVITLKDSENYITDAITGWLQLHSQPSFITNNGDSFKLLGDIAKINMPDYEMVVVDTDKEVLPIIEKTKKLKEIYKSKG
jgi:hypothetical protein